MNPVALIAAKRDGHTHTAADIDAIVAGAASGSWPDYQVAAWLMAAWLRGLDDHETARLTDAMRRSGTTVRFDDLDRPTVDKHSTGGVGDKTSLVLAPLLAACGAAVPMISGRGLGHTGGTLDKLEAIPGFRTDLTLERFRAQVARLGTALAGQTDDLAPADRRLYALRDVTATVESVPLITASILSKKLAEGTGALVLDVKCGRGAFMPTEARARTLAASLVRVARLNNLRCRALLTRMDHPLGAAVGNALEVAESLEILRGRGDPALRGLCLSLGVAMAELAGLAHGETARALLERALTDGSALRVLERVIEAQGGDPRVVERPALLPAAPNRALVAAPADGFFAGFDARVVADVCLELGAGRRRAEDRVDPAVGLDGIVPAGTRVARGQPLATVHAGTATAAEAAVRALTAQVAVLDRQPAIEPHVLGEA